MIRSSHTLDRLETRFDDDRLCDRWAKEGSRTDANRDWADDESVTTVQPKRILLIGRLAQLNGQTAGEGTTRRESFERFRRSLWNPEVLTYDELLDRVRFLVRQAKPAEPPTDEDNGMLAWLR